MDCDLLDITDDDLCRFYGLNQPKVEPPPAAAKKNPVPPIPAHNAANGPRVGTIGLRRRTEIYISEAKLRLLDCCEELGISTQPILYSDVQRLYKQKYKVRLDKEELRRLFGTQKAKYAIIGHFSGELTWEAESDTDVGSPMLKLCLNKDIGAITSKYEEMTMFDKMCIEDDNAKVSIPLPVIEECDEVDSDGSAEFGEQLMENERRVMEEAKIRMDIDRNCLDANVDGAVSKDNELDFGVEVKPAYSMNAFFPESNTEVKNSAIYEKPSGLAEPIGPPKVNVKRFTTAKVETRPVDENANIVFSKESNGLFRLPVLPRGNTIPLATATYPNSPQFADDSIQWTSLDTNVGPPKPPVPIPPRRHNQKSTVPKPKHTVVETIPRKEYTINKPPDNGSGCISNLADSTSLDDFTTLVRTSTKRAYESRSTATVSTLEKTSSIPSTPTTTAPMADLSPDRFVSSKTPSDETDTTVVQVPTKVNSEVSHLCDFIDHNIAKKLKMIANDICKLVEDALRDVNHFTKKALKAEKSEIKAIKEIANVVIQTSDDVHHFIDEVRKWEEVDIAAVKKKTDAAVHEYEQKVRKKLDKKMNAKLAEQKRLMEVFEAMKSR